MPVRWTLAEFEARCRGVDCAPAVVRYDGGYVIVRPLAIPKPGLGDMVAAGLNAVGITKERVGAVAAAVGVKDCGCAQRQAALNAAGRRLGIG